MKRCTICGKTEEDHHQPEWVEFPDRCRCDPMTWLCAGKRTVVLPVCDSYDGNGTEYCQTCCHDKECHEA